jgi:hypothetical protein
LVYGLLNVRIGDRDLIQEHDERAFRQQDLPRSRG